MTSSPPRPNYRPEGVQAAVEEYQALRAKADTSRAGLYALVVLADLDRAMSRLPRKYWEVVLLHGLAGLTQHASALLLQVSQQAVAKRYRKALEDITYYINGIEEDE